MENFIYQIDREDVGDGINLRVFLQNKESKKLVEKVQIPYVIYLKEDDFEKIDIKTENVTIDRGFKNIKEENLIRIELKSQDLYKYLQDLIKAKEITQYEADINPEHRYLIDKKKTISNFKDDKVPKLRYLSIDIETIGKSVDSQEIVLISTYTGNDNEQSIVYVNKEKLPKNLLEEVLNYKPKEFKTIFLDNEKELLQKFRENIIEYDPVAIIGWNVIDFDFKEIKERMEYYKIAFNFSKNGQKEGKLRVRKDFFSKSTLTFEGTIIFDVIQLLKMNFIVFEDYKLNTVAKEVLGDEKIDIDNQEDVDYGIENKMNAIANMLRNDPIKLIEYNFKDSLLTSKIVQKLNLLSLTCERSIITNTPLNKVHSPIASLDIMYLTKLHSKKLIAETNYNFTEQSRIVGAHVIEPVSGFYEDILVMDFSSLYPSIIMTFNIDPFTYSEKGEIIAPNNAKFKREEGILPSLVSELYDMRKKAKKENLKIKSHALKITMNSFYGAMASPKCRFYNKHLAEAITSFGKKIIIEAKDYMESTGNKVIYGDTDSIFIKITKKFDKHKEKEKYSKKLRDQVNNHFNRWTEENYGCKSHLFMDIEKIFSKFFIASKKRYVGLDSKSNELKFTGMEAIRGDWTDLAKNFQVNLVKKIFERKTTKKEIFKFIDEETKKLKSGKYNHLLVYTKKITKPLDEYTKTTPPHVKAAREVKDFSGRIVKYIMTKTGPKHISLFGENDEYDYNHYIEKQLKGVSDDLLDILGISFDEVNGIEKQKSLDSFFN